MFGVSENVDHFQRCSKPNGRAAGGKLFVLSKVPGRGPLYSTGNCTSSGSGTCAWRRAQSSACAGQPSARRGGVRGGGLGPPGHPPRPLCIETCAQPRKRNVAPSARKGGARTAHLLPGLVEACVRRGAHLSCRGRLEVSVSRAGGDAAASCNPRHITRGTTMSLSCKEPKIKNAA